MDDSAEELAIRRLRRRELIFNLATLLMLIGVLCVIGLFWTIFVNPNSALNPFPPRVLTVLPPTLTPTSEMVLPPTWTPTLTLEPTATDTPRPTATPPPTATLFFLATATFTPAPTGTLPPPVGFPFELQKGSPVAIANIYHPELGCNWMGVGGQVVNLSSDPVIGLIIRLGGTLPGVGKTQDQTTLTGVALSYGRAGFEFTLADRPIASQQTLWLQLLNQEAVPISAKVYFDTYDSCEKNLIIINFRQVR